MHERIQKLLDRFESRLALWSAFGGPPVIGLLSGWLSSGVDWINQYGPFGWFVAFLLGTLIASLILLILSWMRYIWVAQSARRQWIKETVAVNPLEEEFRRVRVKIIDLMNPFTRTIESKRLYDCELIGPANLFIFRNYQLSRVSFFDCVGVVLRVDTDGKVYTGGAAVLKDFEMHRGSIYGATILVSPNEAPKLAAFGLPFVTYTGIPEIDNAPIHRHRSEEVSAQSAHNQEEKTDQSSGRANA